MKITEHEMLVTLATMALKLDDLTGADLLDAFKQLGYEHVVKEARTARVGSTLCRIEIRIR